MMPLWLTMTQQQKMHYYGRLSAWTSLWDVYRSCVIGAGLANLNC